MRDCISAPMIPRASQATLNACDATRRARRATTSTAHETDQRASNRSSRQQSAVSGEKEKLRSLMSAIFESGVDDAAWRERLLAERRWQKECRASTCAPVCGSKGRKLRSIEPEPYRSSAEALGLRDYSTGNEPCGGGGQFGVPQHARQRRAMTASRSVPMLDPIHVRCSALMGTLHSGSVLPCSSVELREIEAKARLRAEERELRDLDCEIGRRLEAAQARALNSCNRIASTTSQAQFQALKNFSPDFARPSRLELESGAWTAGRWSRR